MQEVSGEKTEQWNLGSRVLHALARWAARPTLALSVVTGDVESVLYSAVFGFPARLETTFQTLWQQRRQAHHGSHPVWHDTPPS